jgi:hypothetical protein
MYIYIYVYIYIDIHTYIHTYICQALSRLSAAAERKVARYFGAEDTAKMTQALAESMLLRSLFVPVTMPLKLWLTYMIVR